MEYYIINSLYEQPLLAYIDFEVSKFTSLKAGRVIQNLLMGVSMSLRAVRVTQGTVLKVISKLSFDRSPTAVSVSFPRYSEILAIVESYIFLPRVYLPLLLGYSSDFHQDCRRLNTGICD